MVWEETDKRETTSRPDILWPEIWKYVRRVDTQRKAKGGHRKNRGLIIVEICVVFTSLILMIKNSMLIMKIARGKLEVPMPAAMLSKSQREKFRETCRVENCKT